MVTRFNEYLSKIQNQRIKLLPVTHLGILYAVHRDWRKWPGVPGGAIVIFADRRDRRIKLPISAMSDIGY